MAGEEGGMVNNGAMLRVVDHLHWNELRAERKNVQVRLNRLILLQNLRGEGGGREGGREGGDELNVLRANMQCVCQTLTPARSFLCVYPLENTLLSSQRTLANVLRTSVSISILFTTRSVSEACYKQQ